MVNYYLIKSPLPPLSRGNKKVSPLDKGDLGDWGLGLAPGETFHYIKKESGKCPALF